MNTKKTITTLILLTFSYLVGLSQIQEGVVTINSSQEIKNIITKKVNFNKSNPLVNGYRIQLYNGSETGANNTRNKFAGLFPTVPTSIDWDSPEWKIRVGKYKTRLEADKAVEHFKLAFGNAIVIEMKIRM